MVNTERGAVNNGWTVADIQLNHSHHQDKYLHFIKLQKGGEIFEALEISSSQSSKFSSYAGCEVDFVIKSPGVGGKLCWIGLDDIQPASIDFKDAAYMSRDATKCAIELMVSGAIKYNGTPSIEKAAREIYDIMVKLAKENSN